MTALFLQLLPMILGPIITEAIRKLIPKIPKVLLPLTASIAGALSDQGISALAGAVHGPLASVLVGMAGVAVREIYDQTAHAGQP